MIKANKCRFAEFRDEYASAVNEYLENLDDDVLLVDIKSSLAGMGSYNSKKYVTVVTYHPDKDDKDNV
jgi:hypothetical protein